MEGLYENDERLGGLLSLLPADCSRESDFKKNVNKKSILKAEVKGVSIPNLLKRKNDKVKNDGVKLVAKHDKVVLPSENAAKVKKSKKRKSEDSAIPKKSGGDIVEPIVKSDIVKNKKTQKKLKDVSPIIKSIENLENEPMDVCNDVEIKTVLVDKNKNNSKKNKVNDTNSKTVQSVITEDSSSSVVKSDKKKHKKNKFRSIISDNVEIKAINISSALIGKLEKKNKKVAKNEHQSKKILENETVKVSEKESNTFSKNQKNDVIDEKKKNDVISEKKKKRNKIRKEKREKEINAMDVD